jgi:glycerol-3-phosphate dehydrogenase
MLAALKASSAAGLRPDAARSSEDNLSLGTPAKDAQSSTPSPAARADSGGKAMGRDGNEDGEGFDLLIVGGGATGAGVAVDATTRGLSVAMVERDDFGAGAWRLCQAVRLTLTSAADRHLVEEHQAHPRRRALPAEGRL